MNAERARLARLHRLERVRAIAKGQAVAEAAAAEGTLNRLEGLVERTLRLRAEYLARAAPADALELGQRARFLAGLGGIASATGRDADTARLHADRMQQQLAQAERRRAAVEERALSAARRIEQRRAQQPVAARRKLGTALE